MMDKLSPDQKILYQAAERGDIAKFKEIIREVINTKGDLGQTPLYRASNKEEASYWISIHMSCRRKKKVLGTFKKRTLGRRRFQARFMNLKLCLVFK